MQKGKPEGFPCNVYASAESGPEVMCCGKVLLNEPVPFPDYLLMCDKEAIFHCYPP